MSDVPVGNRFAVIDFETTGFSPANGDRCIEVGLVLLQDGQIIDRYSTLMKSDVPISKRITELTGINNSQVRDAPECEQVIQDLILLSKGSTLVAHNAAFDSRFWRNEVSLATGVEDKQAFLCTMKLARRLLPGKPSYKLSELGVDYGYNESERHRALPDTEVTAKLFLDLLRIAGEKYPHERNGIEFLLKLQDTPKNKMASLGHHKDAALQVNIEAVYVEQAKNIEECKSNAKPTTSVEKSDLTEADVLVHIDNENISMSGLETRYYKNGNPSSYRVQITHELLRRSRCISSRHRDILFSKVRQQIHSWDNMVEPSKKYEPTQLDNFNTYTEDSRKSEGVSANVLGNLLRHTLSVNDAVDWDSLRIQKAFNVEEKYPELIERGENGKPIGLKIQSFDKPYPQREAYPKPIYEKFQSDVTFLQSVTFQKSKILKSDRRNYRNALDSWQDTDENNEIHFQEALKQWEVENKLVNKNNNYIEIIYNEELRVWEESWVDHQKELDELNAHVDILQQRYASKESDAIEEYCELVLERSYYPELWQRERAIAYEIETKLLVLDFRLPEIDELPKYLRAELPSHAPALSEDMYLTGDERVSLYGSVVTQIMLRTIHELFEADVIDALNLVCINGYVTQEGVVKKDVPNKIIASAQIEKDIFNRIDLHAVDSVVCFRDIGGRGRFVNEAYWPVDPFVKLSSVMVEDNAESIEPVANYQALPETLLPVSAKDSASYDFDDIAHLPPLDTAINRVRISAEIDQFVRHIYNLSCSRSSEIKLGINLRDIVELDEITASKIPNVGPSKIVLLRKLKSLYVGDENALSDDSDAVPSNDTVFQSQVSETSEPSYEDMINHSLPIGTASDVNQSSAVVLGAVSSPQKEQAILSDQLKVLVEEVPLPSSAFFDVSTKDGVTLLQINKNHVFAKEVLQIMPKEQRGALEVCLAGWARMERECSSERHLAQLQRARKDWGQLLEDYIETNHE